MRIIGKTVRPVPPPERVRAVKDALKGFGLLDDLDHIFFLTMLEDCGIFWPPLLPPKTTAREVSRQARAAVSGQEVAAWVGEMLDIANPRDPQLKRKWVESVTHQTIRGGRIIPIGPHERRRPEPEVTHAIRLMDRHLRDRMNAKARRECIAGVLSAAQGVSVKPARVRARLERAPKPLSEWVYCFKLWKAAVKLNPNTPFPFRQPFAVELEPRPQGRIVIEPIVGLLHGISPEQFKHVLEEVVRIRQAAGPLQQPEVLEFDIDPRGKLLSIMRVALPRLPWQKGKVLWDTKQGLRR